jgi:hypothetical protein
MLRTLFVLLVMLAGLLLVLFVVTDDSPKKRIALHSALTGGDDP